MVTLSIKVEAAQKARLESLAAQRKTTVSRLMRQALERLADESVRAAPTSCYELVRDLFESPSKLDASSEGDRSTNKERLRSFGKRSLK